MSFSIGNDLIKCIQTQENRLGTSRFGLVCGVCFGFFLLLLVWVFSSLPKIQFSQKQPQLDTTISNNLQQSFHWAEGNVIQLFKSHCST